MRIRADIIGIYKSLHTWTGLLAGMALFIAFFAGALTMFKEPLNLWASPHRVQSISSEQLPTLIEKTLLSNSELSSRGFTLHLRTDSSTPAPLTWVAGDVSRNPSMTSERIFWSNLDARGDVVTGQYQASPLGNLIDYLHQTAGIPGTGHHLFGVYVMGVIAILYFIALISGLIVLLPTLVNDFLAMRVGRNLKRFWLDAHNAIGIVSLPFHLMIALTVIVFAFHDFIYDSLQVAVYGDRPIFERPAMINGPTRTIQEIRSPAEILAELQKVSPDFIPREMVYSNVLESHASVRIGGEDNGRILRGATRGFTTINPYKGSVTEVDYLPGSQQGYATIITSFFALHFGNFGGTPVRWLYFLLGMCGAFLFYTGNLLWIEARRRRQRLSDVVPIQRRDTWAMAALTVGVCWGSVAGVASAMTAGKWVHIAGVDISTVYLGVYYTVFLGAVSWAFIVGPARALVHMLGFCSLASLSIPLTAIAVWLLPSLPAWTNFTLGSLSVDLTAFALALCFAVSARKAYRRAWHGATDSVWSVHGK